MKIKADYTNAPSWKILTVKATLPEELKCLDEIAHNMWWVWNFGLVTCSVTLTLSFTMM